MGHAGRGAVCGTSWGRHRHLRGGLSRCACGLVTDAGCPETAGLRNRWIASLHLPVAMPSRRTFAHVLGAYTIGRTHQTGRVGEGERQGQVLTALRLLPRRISSTKNRTAFSASPGPGIPIKGGVLFHLRLLARVAHHLGAGGRSKRCWIAVPPSPALFISPGWRSLKQKQTVKMEGPFPLPLRVDPTQVLGASFPPSSSFCMLALCSADTGAPRPPAVPQHAIPHAPTPLVP